MKTGFSLLGKSTQGKPCFHYRDGFAVQLVNGTFAVSIDHALTDKLNKNEVVFNQSGKPIIVFSTFSITS